MMSERFLKKEFTGQRIYQVEEMTGIWNLGWFSWVRTKNTTPVVSSGAEWSCVPRGLSVGWFTTQEKWIKSNEDDVWSQTLIKLFQPAPGTSYDPRQTTEQQTSRLSEQEEQARLRHRPAGGGQAAEGRYGSLQEPSWHVGFLMAGRLRGQTRDLYHHMKVDKDLGYWFHQAHTVNNGCLSSWFLKPSKHGPARPRQDREHVPAPALTAHHICSDTRLSRNLGKCQVGQQGKGKLRRSYTRMKPPLHTHGIQKQSTQKPPFLGTNYL